jgi:hypothetical protein
MFRKRWYLLSPSYIVILLAHNLVVIIRGTAGAGRTIDVVSEFLCAFFVSSFCPLCAQFVSSLCPLCALFSPFCCSLHQECGHLHSHSIWTARCIKAVTFLIADCIDRRPLHFPSFTQKRLGPTLQVCVSFQRFVCLFIWVPLKSPSWQKTNNSITDNPLNFPNRQPRSFKTSIKS